MSDISDRISAQIDAAGPSHVWVPSDFATFGSRDAIDKTLQRMVSRGSLRDRPRSVRPAHHQLAHQAPLTGLPRGGGCAIPARSDPSAGRWHDGCERSRLTDAIPARVTLHTDTRRRSVQLDNLLIEFKVAAPSRLYWADRPGMRVVQALHWIKDILPGEGERIRKTLVRLLGDPDHGDGIQNDLKQGFGALPGWMQSFLRTIPGFDPMPPADPIDPAKPASRRKASSARTGAVPR